MFRIGSTKSIQGNLAKFDIAGGLFIVAIFLLFISLVFFSLYVDLQKDTWIYGDWIINYSSGFVRRGLIGSIILSQPFFSPPSALAIIHVSLYATFTALLAFQFWPHRHDLLMMTLLFSPLGLLFFVYNHYAIGRKEILFFTAVLLQVQIFNRLSPARVNETLYFIALIAMSAIIILSHDGLFFFCPFLDTIFFVFVIRRRPLDRALLLVGIAFLIQAIIFFICYRYKGTFDSVQTICSSLGEFSPRSASRGVFQAAFSPEDCLKVGGISQLGWDASGTIKTVVRNLANGYPVTYGLTLLIGLASIASLVWRYRFRIDGPQTTAIVVLTLLSVAWTIPLYVVAIDWGRWMQITYLTLLFLTVCLIDTKFLVFDVAESDARYFGLRARLKSISQGWALCIAALFLLVWNPPICCTQRIGFGVIDFIMKAWSFR